MYAIRISKENIKLSIAEINALLGKGKLIGDYYFLEHIDLEKSKRLAMSKAIYKLIGEYIDEKVEIETRKLNWNRIIKGNYAVRAFGLNERECAKWVWESTNNPSVELRNPKNEIIFYLIDKTVYVLIKEITINRDVTHRKPHLRPKHHPSSLDPLLARCLINLTGCEHEIIDPFCGSGGLLIEASLMGLKATGYDIDRSMLWRAKKNLEFENCDAVLKVQDACLIDNVNYVVTDLPYGKNTKKTELIELYSRFVKHLGNVLHERAVIMYPDHKDLKSMIPTTLTIVGEYENYIHKNLVRKILIVEPS